MDNKKMIYSTKQEHMAALVKDRLTAEGIEVLTLDHKDSAYTVFGTIELYVSPENETRAKELIAENNK